MVLASAALGSREAFQYVCVQLQIDVIAFGAASTGNIRQLKALIDELTKREEV